MDSIRCRRRLIPQSAEENVEAYSFRVLRTFSLSPLYLLTRDQKSDDGFRVFVNYPETGFREVGIVSSPNTLSSAYGGRGGARREARYPNNFRHSSLKKLSKTGT